MGISAMLFVVERSLADNQSNGYILSLDIVNQRKLERHYLEKTNSFKKWFVRLSENKGFLCL